MKKSAESKRIIARLYKKVGARVKLFRNNRGLSQEDLAKSIGLTRTSINNIEHGRHKVLLDTLWFISGKLEVSPMELIPQANEVNTSVSKGFPKNTPADVKKWLTEK